MVEILSSQKRVSSGGDDLEHPLADLQHRNVEGAPTQIENGDLAGDRFAEAVGKRGGGGLVEYSQDIQPGDPARVLRRLALTIGEVGRDGDHRFVHRASEVLLGVELELGQDLR